jgi:hypothetical protein
MFENNVHVKLLGPGWIIQFLASNLVPNSLTGTYFETPCMYVDNYGIAKMYRIVCIPDGRKAVNQEFKWWQVSDRKTNIEYMNSNIIIHDFMILTLVDYAMEVLLRYLHDYAKHWYVIRSWLQNITNLTKGNAKLSIVDDTFYTQN